MPNGFYDSKEKWDRLEAPLIELDPILEEYARSNNFKIEKNYHNWPSRSLQWTTYDINRSIQIYLDKEKELLFNLWLVAWKDRDGKRYWKNNFLKKNVLITEITANLRALLDQAQLIVNSWEYSDLESTS